MADQILVQFRSDLAEFRKELADVKEKVNNVGQSAENAGKKANDSFDKLSGTIKSVGAAIGIAFGVQQIVSFTKESIQLAKQAEGIERAFSKLNKANLLGELRTAVNGTVSDVKLMQAAVKANNFKLPLEQLATLFKFAAQRARDTGESVDYLVESIVLGISRKSIPILDNLGLSATEVQTEFAKTGDMATAVGNIISKSMGGDDPNSAASAIDRASANIENMKVKLGELLLVPTGAAAKGFTDFLEFMSTPANQAALEKIDRITNSYRNSLDKLAKSGKTEAEIQAIQTAALREQLKTVQFWEAERKRLGESDNTSLQRLHKERERLFIIAEINKQRNADVAALKDTSRAEKDLIKIQEELLSIAQLMPQTTEAEITAKNKKIKSIEEEIKRLKELGIEEDELNRKLNEQLEKTRKEQAEFVKKLKTDEFDSDKYEQELFDNDMARIEEETAKQTAANEAMGLSNDNYTEKVLSNIDQTVNKNEAAKDKMLEDEQELLNQRIKNAEITLNLYNNLSSALVEIQNNITQNEINNLEARRKSELKNEKLTQSEIKAINDKYDAEIKKKRQDQWRRERNAAIASTVINTAAAVMKAYFDSGVYGAVAAAAVGAAQIAVIASEPEPEFHKGEIDIRPKGKKRLKNGEFKATLLEGESVINPKSTALYKDELKAINDKKFDELLLKKYILPVIEEKTQKARTTGDNMAKNIHIQSYNGSNVVEMLMRVNATSRENTAILASALKQFKPNLRQPQ